jgi:hypothetical protein
MKKESDRARGLRMLTQSQRAFNLLDDMRLGDHVLGAAFGGQSMHSAKKVALQNAKRRYKHKQMLLQMEAYWLIKRKNGSDPVFTITKLGRTLLEKTRLRKKRAVLRAQDNQKEWDGEWRMVTFDVPESKRSIRDATRYLLKRHGYMQIHENVWVFPFDTEELTEFLKAQHDAREHIIQYRVTKTSADTRLRKMFGFT